MATAGEEQPAHTAPTADESTLPAPDAPPPSLSDLGLAVGAEVEVSWEVELTDGSSGSVWWSGLLEAGVEPGSLQLKYAAAHGFEEETRAVRFVDSTLLMDTALQETLSWRMPGEEEGEEEEEEGDVAAGEAVGAKRPREGEEEDVAGGSLRVGALVKARLDASGRSFSASVHARNEDGTFDLSCDGSLVEGVPAALVEPVAVGAAVADSLLRDEPGGHIEGTSAFFDAFTAALTSGPKFRTLTAAPQPAGGGRCAHPA